MADNTNKKLPHIIPNVDAEMLAKKRESAIKSAHKASQLFCVGVGIGHGYVQKYHNCMMRVKIQISEIHHDGFIRAQENFPSYWNKTNYLENVLAENIHTFCVCKIKDPEDYVDV